MPITVTDNRGRPLAQIRASWDRGRFSEQNRRRRQREARAPGRATPVQVKARVAFYGGLCWICRKRPYDVLDHVKPLARGGSAWPANLRPACSSCNCQKGHQWPFSRHGTA